MQVIIGLAVLCVAVAALFWMQRKLKQRIESALGGADTKSIEQSLNQYFKRIQELELKATDAADGINRLGKQVDLASQKISIVRFNPFGDTGGDQSFSLAVLDTNNSGYVLTSIHGRENTRTYIKPIDMGVSKYTLSKEEKQAIDQASKRVPKATKPGSHG